jgi:single-strand DNA-binding protein
MHKLNTITIDGNLTRDIDIRYLQDGTPVGNFGICHNESKKNGDKWEDVPNFFNGTIWGKQAEFLAEHLKKGAHVCITGKLRQNSYTDKDGNRRNDITITASSILPIMRFQKADVTPQAAPNNDDVPF